MGKETISWVGLVTVLSKESKEKGNAGGLKDVFAAAKKRWKIIKSGQDKKYINGNQSKLTKKVPRGSKRKNKTGSNIKTGSKRKKRTVKQIMKDCELCTNCIKNIKQLS